jgi:hypothetical protein
MMVSHRVKIAQGQFDVDKELAKMWQQLGAEKQEEFMRRWENGDLGNYEEEKQEDKQENKDEDTEMADQADDDNEA